MQNFLKRKYSLKSPLSCTQVTNQRAIMMAIRGYRPDFPYQLFITFGPIPREFLVQISVLFCDDIPLKLVPKSTQKYETLCVLSGQSPDYAPGNLVDLLTYLIADYFETRQIMFDNNMNTIETQSKWG